MSRKRCDGDIEAVVVWLDGQCLGWACSRMAVVTRDSLQPNPDARKEPSTGDEAGRIVKVGQRHAGEEPEYLQDERR